MLCPAMENVISLVPLMALRTMPVSETVVPLPLICFLTRRVTSIMSPESRVAETTTCA